MIERRSLLREAEGRLTVKHLAAIAAGMWQQRRTAFRLDSATSAMTAMTVIFLTVITALSVAFSAPRLSGQFLDLRAFYCAGQAERSGADPYREHPLNECEQKVNVPGFPPKADRATVPVPFPGFVLALFAALALLPFPLALYVWEAAACAAVGFAIVLAARTTRTSVTANAIVIGFPAVILALQLGQVTPFVLLAVVGAASFLQSGRPRLAAVTSLGALLDPHVGLALVLGLFIGVPRARLTLIAGTAALVTLGVFASGPAREWEFLHAVLPAHAFANVTDAAQFSTTYFAYATGVPPARAVQLGSLWYLGALVAGVFAGLRLRSKLGIVTLAYVPAAIAVFGGTHTHLQQLAIAIPAFMLLSSAATGRQRDLWSVVTFVAAIPWLFIAPFSWLYAAPPALALVFAREMRIGRQGIRLAAGSLVALVVMMIAILRTHVQHKPLEVTIPGNPLAEVSWQMFTVARNVPTEAWSFVAKAPTVIAFLLLFGAFARIALRPSVPNTQLRAPLLPLLAGRSRVIPADS